MNTGVLKLIPLEDLIDNQQVIVIDQEDNQTAPNFPLIGRVEGLYDYKLRFWKQARNDEEKRIWITSKFDPINGKLNEFAEFSCNYEFSLSDLRNLVVESDGKTYTVDYIDWIDILRDKSYNIEVDFSLSTLNDKIAKLK